MVPVTISVIISLICVVHCLLNVLFIWFQTWKPMEVEVFHDLFDGDQQSTQHALAIVLPFYL